MQPWTWDEQRHQPEDPFELLLHRLPDSVERLLIVLELCPQRAEHLIRAVVTGDLRREQQLDDLFVDPHLGMHIVQLVQRRDHAMAKRDVRLQQAFDEYLRRDRRADPHEHLRQLPLDLERRPRVIEALVKARHDRVPVLRERGRPPRR